MAVRLLPVAGHPRLLWCFALRWPGDAVLLDESLVNRGPDELAGGDGHTVELTEARNRSWKPEDPIGLLRVHWVSCGRDPCKQ